MIIEFDDATEDQVLGIPYTSGAGYGAGFPNIGFIDLLNEPHRINEIPEILDFPVLKDLVIYLNSHTSAFITLRTDSGTDFFEREGFRNSAFFFLTICVRRLHPSEDLKLFHLLNRELRQFLVSEQAPQDASIRLRASRLEIPGKDNFAGVCLDFFIEGFGSRKKLAVQQRAEAMSFLYKYLKRFNESLVSGFYNKYFSD